MTGAGVVVKAQKKPSMFSANERAWVEFIRGIEPDRDPGSTLAAVQALREVLGYR